MRFLKGETCFLDHLKLWRVLKTGIQWKCLTAYCVAPLMTNVLFIWLKYPIFRKYSDFSFNTSYCPAHYAIPLTEVTVQM